jgi:transcriptional regulator with XRE-family HTH domain
VATTNPELRRALLKKLGISPQALSQRAQRRKAKLPMSTPQAVYTIAHDEGIDVSSYLSSEETAEVRALVGALRDDEQAQHPPERRKAKAAASKKEVKVTIAGVDIGKVPALKKSHGDDAKRMSERVYPTIYLFENSVRDLIEGILAAKHGKEWWSEAVPKKVRETAQKHKEAEAKDPWHSARGKREIDYVFLNDLWAIIKDNWPEFKDLFPDQAWVQTLITNDMNVSRRVFAHMNPLGADDISNLEAAFRKWTKTLQAADEAGKLP